MTGCFIRGLNCPRGTISIPVYLMLCGLWEDHLQTLMYRLYLVVKAFKMMVHRPGSGQNTLPYAVSHPTFLFALYTFTIVLRSLHKASCHAPKWASCSYKSRTIIGLVWHGGRECFFFSFPILLLFSSNWPAAAATGKAIAHGGGRREKGTRGQEGPCIELFCGLFNMAMDHLDCTPVSFSGPNGSQEGDRSVSRETERK